MLLSGQQFNADAANTTQISKIRKKAISPAFLRKKMNILIYMHTIFTSYV